MSPTAVQTDSSQAKRTVSWHGLTAEQACRELGVDPGAGVDGAEVARRREQYGMNKLAEAEKEPGWHAFLRQYKDLMQLVLVGAAVVSVVDSRGGALPAPPLWRRRDDGRSRGNVASRMIALMSGTTQT